MSRYFGIAGIQMAPEPWNASATLDKMQDIVAQVSRSFPWVNLCLFHELVVPGLVQFVPTPRPDTWRQDAQPIPGPLSDRLCAIACASGRWLAPGSMYELADGKIYNTALVISPQGESSPNTARSSPGCPSRPAQSPAPSSASSTSRRWGASACASATTRGSRRRCARWRGWAPR